MNEFTKEYNYKVDLCYKILHYTFHHSNEQTEKLIPSQTRKILLNFFDQDIINQAMKKLLGENIK